MFESWDDKLEYIKVKIDELIDDLVSELSADASYEVSIAEGQGYTDGYKDAEKEFFDIRNVLERYVRNVLERYDRDNSQCHVCNRIGPHSPECVFQSIYNILDN